MENFKKVNIDTQINDWKCLKKYNSFRQNITGYKFHHSKLGFFDLEEDVKSDSYTMDLLKVFRYATGENNNLSNIKKLFSQIIKKTNNPNYCYYEDNEYNLTNAIKCGNIETIKYLVENGVWIHTPDEKNIIDCLSARKYDIAKYFLENDEKIDQQIIMKSKHYNEETKSFLDAWNLYHQLTENINLKSNRKNKTKI